jgi:hypothetical protein
MFVHEFHGRQVPRSSKLSQYYKKILSGRRSHQTHRATSSEDLVTLWKCDVASRLYRRCDILGLANSGRCDLGHDVRPQAPDGSWDHLSHPSKTTDSRARYLQEDAIPPAITFKTTSNRCECGFGFGLSLHLPRRVNLFSLS